MLDKAILHLAKNDALLADVIKLYGPCTITPHTDYYRELLDSIVSQQLSVKAASTIFGRFLGLYGGATPTPEQILNTPHEDIRAVGCSNAKARYIRDLAQHIYDGRLDLNHIATLPNEAIITQLTAVKGIGEWSAHMFLIFSLGRLDVLPTGDLGIRKGMQKL
jgi:DNA-3-methyladenine glycosylase II